MNSIIITHLTKVLADSYALYLKTQNYHWNIQGANFINLHLLFESQYKDLAEAIDVVAELIRSLGTKVPGSFETFIQTTTIKSGDENAKDIVMLKDLISDNEGLQKTLEQTLKVAQEKHDEVVVSFITDRLTVHRKATWMLKSSL